MLNVNSTSLFWSYFTFSRLCPYDALGLISLFGEDAACLEDRERIKRSNGVSDAGGSRRTKLSHLREAKPFIIPCEWLSARRADQAN